MDDFLGKYAWEEVVDAEVIQAAITRCVTTGEPQTFESVSADGRWRTQFHHFGEYVIGLVRFLAPAPSLTVMEAAILALMAADQTTRMISTALKTSSSAVNTHTSTMRRKFGVRTNYGMVLTARDAGLI